MDTRRPRALFEGLEPRTLLATFIVDTAIDESDGDFGEGDFSLREAVEEANAAAGADTITFAPGLASATITLGSVIGITGGLTISGLGTTSLTISGGGTTRIFNIDDGAAGASVAVSISGMTLTRGSAPNGGAILNSETLTLTGVGFADNTSTENGGALMNLAAAVVNTCTFTGNSTGSSGGGIHNEAGGTLSVVNSTFTGNTAGGGGAVRNVGTAVISDSTFTGNVSNGVAGRGGAVCSADGSNLVMSGGLVTQNTAPSGGGVSTTGTISLFGVTITANNASLDGAGVVSFEGGDITIEGTTISGNIAAGSGGGISVRGPLTVRNSTISGNAAGDSGGGVRLASASATITNSTIVFNGAAGGLGGGIYVEGGVVTLTSTIVAFNAFGTPAAFSEILLGTGGSVSPTSANNLVFDAGSSAGLVNGVNGNLVGANPLLGPLANSGGGVSTHALLAGSPAIDTGTNPGAMTTDQRGYPRVGGTAPDIGAYETRVYATDVGSGRLVYGAADRDDLHRVATVNRDGAIIVFEQGWSAVNLQERTGAPNAISDAVIWVDPKDNLTYVAAPSAAGLLLFRRAFNGAWSFRNLQAELGAPASPTGNLTQFTSRRGLVVLVGTTADNRLVSFQQNNTTVAGGPGFVFVDVSAQVVANGGQTPVLTNLISYVTTWDAWHLAGLDAGGDIQSVWLHIPGGTVTTWRVDNLSTITGAPPGTGQLAVTLTPWGGINLTAQDQSGQLITTWWVPGEPWRTNNLTEQFAGAPLTNGNVTGYTTPWGGLNYAGFADDGTVTVYWWAPGKDNWEIAPLLPASVPAGSRPAGTLTSFASQDGTLNVLGSSASGDAIRMWWNPGAGDSWAAENLTQLAARQ